MPKSLLKPSRLKLVIALVALVTVVGVGYASHTTWRETAGVKEQDGERFGGEEQTAIPPLPPVPKMLDATSIAASWGKFLSERQVELQAQNFELCETFRGSLDEGSDYGVIIWQRKYPVISLKNARN